MSKKLTPRFPADVKPVYVGWYHTGDGGINKRGSPWNTWWDGEKWYWESNDTYSVASIQSRIWRGLAEKP